MADAELLEQLRGSIRAIEANSPSNSSGRVHRDDGSFSFAQGEIHDYQGEHAFPENASQGDSRKRRGQPSSALDVILNLVNVSDRSEHAIRERLLRDGFPDEEIESAVTKAKDYGFINDARYAEVLVRSRISQGKGSAGIERELRSQKIEIEIVEGWPHEYPVSYDEELNRAIDLLERKPPRSKNLRDGAYRKLMGKGYSSAIASAAARMWTEGLQRET